MKTHLFGETLEDLKKRVQIKGFPSFTATQIADWLYKKKVSSIDEMTNLSKKTREELKKECDVGLIPPQTVQTSVDGTKKYLFPTHKNEYIETAMIPFKERKTVCLSSQVGCKWGCRFCVTGEQGFQSQLSANEILNQFRMLPEQDSITNLVYMGMGEPFDNLDEVLKSIDVLTSDWGYALSPRRITVSSIGLQPERLESFLAACEAHLAISLHSPFLEERKQLMPVEATYSFEDTLQILRKYNWHGQRRISFEYIVFGHLNDTPKHAEKLIQLLKGIPCRINLIRFHPGKDKTLQATNETVLQRFKEHLNAGGILTTIRASRGLDIDAACGLLSSRNNPSKPTDYDRDDDEES